MTNHINELPKLLALSGQPLVGDPRSKERGVMRLVREEALEI